MQKVLLLIIVFVLAGSPVWADELSELKQMMRQMQRQMRVMENRIQELEQEKHVQAREDQETIQELQASFDKFKQARDEESKGILSTLNPEVSVIGDFVYKADDNGGEGDNDFNLREVEIAFSANVDTWARADVIVAVENEDGDTVVAIEEGYLTLLETPIANLQGKFGKFRPFFGKANRMHLHQLPWTNYPLVVQNFFGEEGFSEAGASLSYLIPNPADIFSEITLEAVNNGGTVFGGGEEGETIYLGHWKNFFELTDITSLEVGASYAFGENGLGNGAETHLSGFDVTVNTELFDQRRTTSHTEAVFNTREQAMGNDINSWGMFTSLEQQLTDRWWAFGRYDFSQTPTASNEDTHAYSAGLTFAQSEYVFWRVMYTHTDNEMSADDNTVWFQLDFSIGPHKPHAYR